MSTPQFPHAALLIDFDNVTMGIRSDLSKELKNLLSSDFIKGKVAVQRAYADWRRYPQYIVPLAESSVDLIFAPAYGSSKKNATDIRLAIDALELVFTRPEIGTFILLSGDSDFSSLVLKLKEYGKYVVGVGIRESASDLLVQNCDEYYSYSALSGLTRAGDEPATAAEDPWELVELAIKQMTENDDVMRSDRLKQVILEMDPSFDEKALGFQKFNRFMQEAASRGLVSLRKLENGQFEVALPGVLGEAPPPEEDFPQQGNGRRRSRRGRGRDRERESVPDRAREQPVGEEVTAEASPVAETAAAEEVPPPRVRAQAVREAAPEPVVPAVALAETAASAEAVPAPAPAEERVVPPARVPAGKHEDPLRAAYGLLRQAVSDVGGRAGDGARDSDIKRRMLELESGWDEAALGFSKFSRFLRQAHDAEVINLRKLDNGGYEASVAAGGEAMGAVAGSAAERPRGRGRRERGRTATSAGTPTPAREEVAGESRSAPVRSEAAEPGPAVPSRARATAASAAAAPPSPAKAASSQAAAEHSPAAAASSSAPAARAPAAVTPASAARTAPPVAPARPVEPPRAPLAGPAGLGIGMRRGSRGRMPSAAPPPLLEGQTVPRAAPLRAPAAPVIQTVAESPPVPAPMAEPAAAEAAAASRPTRARRGRRGRSGEKSAPGEVQAVAEASADARAVPTTQALATPSPVPEARRTTPPRKAARKSAAHVAPAAPAARAPAEPDLKSLGLPTDRDAVVAYLRGYEGLGPKSVQNLVDAFGAGGVFRALRDQPERVREAVGGTRGERLLEAWQKDYQRRVKAQAKKQSTGRGGRGRRGGRGGKKATSGS